jgi:hypothetical protein
MTSVVTTWPKFLNEFYVQKKKRGSFSSPFLTHFSTPNSKLCMYVSIDGCLEERSDFMDLTQKKKKARVYTLIFVFDRASTLAVVGFKSTSCMDAGLCQIF